MTDARLPDRWLLDRRFHRLDDRSFRSYVMALLWAVLNETDGVINDDDLALIPKFAREAIPALLMADLWEVRDDTDGIGWRIGDFATTQTSKDDLEVLRNARAAGARKKKRQRQRQKPESTGTSRGRVPRDMSPGTAQARTGQARTGETPGETGVPSQPERNSHGG